MPCINNTRLQPAHRNRSITIPQRRRRRLSRRRLSTHCVLSTIGEWDFNVFTMDNLTNGRPMFYVGLRMLQDHGLIEYFHLDIVKLMRCLSLIEEGYMSSNPYHNSIHAADVGQAFHCYLNEPQIASHVTQLEKLIGIFSALAHDVAHPGVSNSFLVNTNSHLAALYNNESVLENHHWRTVISIFHQTGIFAHLDKVTVATIESRTKSLILATDITKQKELLSQFTECLDTNSFSLSQEDNRHLVLQMAMKCADLSNTTRRWEVSSAWSAAVCQEFFAQGDMERKLGLPVAPVNDRRSTTVAQIQTGFMQGVVLPLFTEWQRFNPSELSGNMLHNLQANKAEWEAVLRKTKAQDDSETQDEVTSDSNRNDLNPLPPSADAPADPVTHSTAGKKRSYATPDGNSDDDMSPYEADDADCDVALPRRHSLPVSLPEDGGCQQWASRHLAALQRISLNTTRRQSLPVSDRVQSGLDVLVESPTVKKTVQFDEEELYHMSSESDDGEDDCHGCDVTPATREINYRLWGSGINTSQIALTNSYHTKRRCSAPNTTLLASFENSPSAQKVLESDNRDSAGNDTENIAVNDQVNYPFSRRRSLPLKAKDLHNFHKKLTRQSSFVSRVSLRRRNSLPVFVKNINNTQDISGEKENSTQEYTCQGYTCQYRNAMKLNMNKATSQKNNNSTCSDLHKNNAKLHQLKRKQELSLHRVLRS